MRCGYWVDYNFSKDYTNALYCNLKKPWIYVFIIICIIIAYIPAWRMHYLFREEYFNMPGIGYNIASPDINRCHTSRLEYETISLKEQIDMKTLTYTKIGSYYIPFPFKQLTMVKWHSPNVIGYRYNNFDLIFNRMKDIIKLLPSNPPIDIDITYDIKFLKEVANVQWPSFFSSIFPDNIARRYLLSGIKFLFFSKPPIYEFDNGHIKGLCSYITEQGAQKNNRKLRYLAILLLDDNAFIHIAVILNKGISTQSNKESELILKMLISGIRKNIDFNQNEFKDLQYSANDEKIIKCIRTVSEGKSSKRDIKERCFNLIKFNYTDY